MTEPNTDTTSVSAQPPPAVVKAADNNAGILAAALQLFDQGICVIPVEHGTKKPAAAFGDWTELELTHDQIKQIFSSKPYNIGVHWGPLSDWRIDIDLDTDEAVYAASFFFKKTYTYGRKKRPNSHLIFKCEGAKNKKYSFGEIGTLLEIHGEGRQSVVPPSIHPDDDQYCVASPNCSTRTISLDELTKAAERTAVAALFARCWKGGRHAKALALTGALLNAGWPDDDVATFVAAVVYAAKDEEATDRKRACGDTIKRYRKGTENVTGWPTVAEHFGDAITKKAREWLHIQDGAQLNGSAALQAAVNEPWPQVQPLVETSGSALYPVDALPGNIGGAVKEITGFVQCPVSLAACSTLGVLSLAGQGLADVRRVDALSGPCSLYLLAVADSGERKTSCDYFFKPTLEAWEDKKSKCLAPKVAEYNAKEKLWAAKCKGLTRAIDEAAKLKESTDADEAELIDLEANKPQIPPAPGLLYGDTTSEALAFELATKWPSSGVLCSEAGIVFGGHAMGRESLTRNLALLNALWDGGSHRVTRRTSDSFKVAGVRLTMSLAVQPLTVRAFFENSKGLARGSGFAARFLIAWPTSTQGERPYRSPPPSWPCLSAFRSRIIELLDKGLNTNEAGRLTLPILDLSPAAKDVWIHYHDEIERELKRGGDMFDTRDVASKAADNATRLAALFHLYEQGMESEISADHMRAASRIVTWHLYEAKRFLSELVLPLTASNAAKLNDWLVQHCRAEHVKSVNAGYVLQFGPLRDKRMRDEAITALEEAGRVRLIQNRRQKDVYVNPALLSADHEL